MVETVAITVVEPGVVAVIVVVAVVVTVSMVYGGNSSGNSVNGIWW